MSRDGWERIGRYIVDSRPRLVTGTASVGILSRKGLTSPLEITDQELAAAGYTRIDELQQRTAEGYAEEPLNEGPPQFLVPLEPGKVVGVGLNYRSHAIEVGAVIPKNPLLFAKFNTSPVGRGAANCLNRAVAQAEDWDVELAVVVGRTPHCASRNEVQSAIFRYTVANDATVRDIQVADIQWTPPKCSNTFGPSGPWLVPASAIDASKARLRARVDGVLMQDGTISDMIFDVTQLLSFCSWDFALHPAARRCGSDGYTT